MARVTRDDIEYSMAWAGTANIPAGTSVQPADNLPTDDEDPKYWADKWDNMTEDEEGWYRNYGFLISESETLSDDIKTNESTSMAPEHEAVLAAVRRMQEEKTQKQKAKTDTKNVLSYEDKDGKAHKRAHGKNQAQVQDAEN